MYKMIIPVALSGIIGAFVSKKVKAGQFHPAWVIVSSIVSGLAWVWIIKKYESSLVVSGAIYDVIYSLAYFAVFMMMGETVTLIQGVGVALSVIGLVCLNY